MTVENERLQMLLLKARENSVAYVKHVLVENDLTEQQWRVVRVLHRDGESTAQDLARESCILSPSLSRILVRLENEGLLIRKVDSNDQRALNLRLSAKGKRLHNKIAPKMEKQYQSMTKTVGRRKLSDLVNMLQEFTEIQQTA